MELSYPDGFVATFWRVSPGEDIDRSRAFYTVVGYDYDAEQGSRAKEATFTVTQALTTRVFAEARVDFSRARYGAR